MFEGSGGGNVNQVVTNKDGSGGGKILIYNLIMKILLIIILRYCFHRISYGIILLFFHFFK
jgi:hypothetical protein